ncbi:unnamed protein product [Lactuca saligna]|uniref:histone deacetylase n=1 Tax=Lactuca saligna TaxID=75948 RepID=A0AA35Y641_LACSI|nr:unnamed protein product [Lactuca saligna]
MVRRNLGKTTRMRRRKKVNYLISFLLVLIFSLMFDVFSGGDGRRTRYSFVEGVVGKSDGVLLVVASSSSSSPISRCRHCKKLPPEWKKAAKNLQGKVKLGYVNYDDEKSLMSRFKDVMEEKCGSATICFVSFLPDILDSKAEGRNKYIEILLSVAEKFKRSPYRKHFRLLPFGVQPKLTYDEMKILRRLGRPLPCHFSLGEAVSKFCAKYLHQMCGEHKDSGILRHGFLASSSEEADSIQNASLKQNGKSEASCSKTLAPHKSTAVGFDDKMLLHSEVERKSLPHPERPDRLRAIAASLATAGIFPGRCQPISAREITPRLAAGLCADLASAIYSGCAKNGFALVRPPGHHVGVRQAMGFCLHNNAAIVASAAQAAGAKKDVHHGNGTQEIFEQNKTVLYISLHRHEGGKFYPGTGAAHEVGSMGGEGYCVNVPWSRGGVGTIVTGFAKVVTIHVPNGSIPNGVRLRIDRQQKRPPGFL